MEDLGEETFPEPKDSSATAPAASSADDTASIPSPASTLVNDSDSVPSSPSSPLPNTVKSQEPLPNEPISSQIVDELLNPTKAVTTDERKPMKIPDSVHMKITIDNLKDYVGPPIYQKDRMYVTPPPPGVSTGLGYLGNGSGAVMPVEAMVCIRCLFS